LAARESSVEVEASVVSYLRGVQLAAVQLSNQHRAHHLGLGIEAGRRVGAAVGILAARWHLQPEAAFDVLRTVSQHRNQKLRVIAEEVINDARPTSPPES
jgi:AmiR/NasT family two-component response regulator